MLGVRLLSRIGQQTPCTGHRMRIALLLEYDGAAYGGSQRQRNAPSIQAAVEEAIERLSGPPVRVALAGRTDRGVHALGQVAAFETVTAHTPETWRRALNAHLPEDIAVRAVQEVSAGFDPRRHARSRTYRYRVWNAPVRSPLRSRQAWHVRESLNLPAMMQVAATLVGDHDFAAFGGSPGPGRSTRRRILRSELCARGPLLIYEVEGTAFLPHQVRRTVGALVEVGRGRVDAERFDEWLATARPNAAGPAAPPHGLCLMAVTYADLRFDADRPDEESR